MISNVMNYMYSSTVFFQLLFIKHYNSINFAISSNTNPSSHEILLSIDTASGVAINTNARIENYLTNLRGFV